LNTRLNSRLNTGLGSQMNAHFAAGPPDEGDDDGPRVAEFLAHCQADRPAALRLAACITVWALLIAALLPPSYTATATLAVLPAPEFTVRQDAGSHAFSSAALAMDQIMKAETAILESDALHASTLGSVGTARLYPSLDQAHHRSVVGGILHGASALLFAPWRVAPSDPDAARQEEALRRFKHDLTVLPAKDANVITVSLSNHDAALAAGAVNTMLASYAAQRFSLYDDPQLPVVRQQTEALARAVREADAALAAFKAAHAITDIATERDLLLRRRSETAQALAAASANIAEQQARLAALAAQLNRLPPTIPLFREDDADTRVQAVDVALVDLRGRLESAREQYRDTSHKVTDLRAQVLARETERRRMLASPIPSMDRTGRTPALDPLLLDRAHAAAEAAAAAARATALRHDLGDEQDALARLNADETALADLARRKAVAAESFASASRVQDEQRMTEAEDARRLATVRIIQPARVPQQPGPARLLTALAGMFLGPLTALASIFVRFVLRPTFLTPEGLAAATGLPVLGVFPADAENYGF
jgi:uncharacterized protein involved in exopolysaccharide biosynthesis